MPAGLWQGGLDPLYLFPAWSPPSRRVSGQMPAVQHLRPHGRRLRHPPAGHSHSPAPRASDAAAPALAAGAMLDLGDDGARRKGPFPPAVVPMQGMAPSPKGRGCRPGDRVHGGEALWSRHHIHVRRCHLPTRPYRFRSSRGV